MIDSITESSFKKQRASIKGRAQPTHTKDNRGERQGKSAKFGAEMVLIV